MTFGLRCCQPACRPHPASLPIRVPTVEGLLPASFSFTSRLRLAVRYGYRHRFRLAPFIQLDSAMLGTLDSARRGTLAQPLLAAAVALLPPRRAKPARSRARCISIALPLSRLRGLRPGLG